MTLSFLPVKPVLTKWENKPIAIIIKNDSYLKILGSTNVNTFSCGYEGKITTDTLNINIQKVNDRILLDNAKLSVEVDRFDCGNSGMNKDFRTLLAHEQFPQMKVSLTSLLLSDQQKFEAKAIVTIEIAGQLETYTVPIQLEEDNEQTYYLGRQALNIRDFDLAPPKKFLGMVIVDEEVIIDFKLNLSLL